MTRCPVAVSRLPVGSSANSTAGRVTKARAIVTDPAIVLADEPTGNLDSHSTEEILGVFARLNADGRTVVLITHESDVAARARRVVRLADGRVLSDDAAGSREEAA